MKAIIYTKYGPPDVLHLKDVDKPAPRDDEVLVRVISASVNAADWRFMRGEPFLLRLYAGLLKPRNKMLGTDMAGRVETVGKNVKQFQPGDAVFGISSGAVKALLPSMCAPVKMHWCENRMPFRSRKRRPCRWRRSPPCKVSGVKDGFDRGKRF